MKSMQLHSSKFKTLHKIKTPRVFRTVARMMSILVLLIILFLIFVPWIQITQGLGTITALNPTDRLQEINALVAGRIKEWHVRDGSLVKAGDPIVQIVDNDPLLLQRLEAERAQIRAKLGAARTAVTTARLDLTRTRNLYKDGLASRREYEKARINVEKLRSSEASAAAELNRIQVNFSRQAAQTVRAPRDGVILRVNAGDVATVVKAGQVIATFVPTNVERAVEIFINGRDVALVRPGHKARLQFEGWPAVQFSGWPSVAIGTFGGIVSAVDPSASEGGKFRVLITEDPDDPNPWPDETYLRFGVKTVGWVLLGEVSVGYEIWRRLNNFPPEFPNVPNSNSKGSSSSKGSK